MPTEHATVREASGSSGTARDAARSDHDLRPSQPPAAGKRDSHRYFALDAMRGAAAFAVLFYHLRLLDAPDRPAVAPSAFASGYLAVDLFFVLSGFVIAHAYSGRLRQGMGLREFTVARFIRLQPVIAIGTLLGFALALTQRIAGLDGSPGVFAIVTTLPLNLALLPNAAVPWGPFLFNPPAWSLFYELAANLGFAWLLVSVSRGRIGDRAFVCILLVLLLCGGSGLLAAAWLGGDLDRGVVLSDAPVALARIAFSFPLGVLLHMTRALWLTRLPSIPLPLLLAGCVALLAPDVTGSARSAYDLVFAFVASPLLVMLGATTVSGPRLAGAAAWLGMISYPLYGTHALRSP